MMLDPGSPPPARPAGPPHGYHFACPPADGASRALHALDWRERAIAVKPQLGERWLEIFCGVRLAKKVSQTQVAVALLVKCGGSR